MSHRSKIIKEWVEVEITAANQRVKEKIEVDAQACAIIGLALTSNLDELLYYRGSQRVVINEKEIYPEGYESKMLMQGINVPVNERIIGLGEEIAPGNRVVELDYTDSFHTAADFTPYRVRLYVYSRIDEQQA